MRIELDPESVREVVEYLNLKSQLYDKILSMADSIERMLKDGEIQPDTKEGKFIMHTWDLIDQFVKDDQS